MQHDRLYGTQPANAAAGGGATGGYAPYSASDSGRLWRLRGLRLNGTGPRPCVFSGPRHTCAVRLGGRREECARQCHYQ